MVPDCPLTPLLADVEKILGAVVVIFWIVGWLIKLVATQNQKNPPVANRPRPPARPRDERLQEEIDIFIQEVSPQRTPPRRPAPQSARPAPPPARPTPPTARRKPIVATPAPPAPPKPPRRVRPGEEIATRAAPVTQDLGTGVKQHLTQYMADKVSQEVAA